MALEVPRTGQGFIDSPDFTGELIERDLVELAGPQYAELPQNLLRRIGLISPTETIELNSFSSENYSPPGIFTLFRERIKEEDVTVSFVLPKRDFVILPNFSTNTILRHLIRGRVGLYTGKNFDTEDVLHDWGELGNFKMTSEDEKLGIVTWENPAFLLTRRMGNKNPILIGDLLV